MAESEGESEHLSELRRRWEEEPSSRLFLQLAEEYRRVGRTDEALQVLEQGLGHNPRYVSAQVAKGRCLLELGRAEEAAVALRQVLANDATHLVASKLLVEAYILQGDALQARRQLEHYGTLSNADPEVETLRERIQDLVLSDAEPSPEPQSAAPPAEAAVPEAPPEEAAVPEAPEEAAVPEAPEEAAAPEAPEEAAVSEEAAAPEVERSLSPLPAGDPFPDLHAPDDRERSLGRFAADGVFEPLAAPAAAAEEPAKVEEPLEPVEVAEAVGAAAAERATEMEGEAASPPPAEVEEAVEAVALAPAAEGEQDDTVPLGPWGSGPVAAVGAAAPAEVLAAATEAGAGDEPFPGLAAAASPAFAFDPDLEAPSAAAATAPSEGPVVATAGLPGEAEREPEQEVAEEAPEAAAEEGEEEPATATLGQLYLRQGHFSEAERIFRRVLDREPENRAAREGLASLPGGAAAASGDEAADPAAVAGELVVRKLELLRRYLSVLRRGAERDVS